MNWLEYYILIAEQIKLKSKDENTKIGVVIVGPNQEIRSTGYNSFPIGLNDNLKERQSREEGEKYFWFEHAERNAIYNAARVGIPLDGCLMYLTCGCPCADCARAVIQAGIKTIWIRPGNPITGKPSTLWDKHAEKSRIMFKESGVQVNYWNYNENNKPVIHYESN